MLVLLSLLALQTPDIPPSAAKSELAQPLGVTGTARVDCLVTDAGGLSNCTVLSETPVGKGIAKAALDYAATLTVKLGEGPNAFQPGSHFVRTLKVEMPLPTMPEGYADIRCNVMPDGKLDGCVVLNESPTGMGFGDNALKMAPFLKVKTNGAAGQTYRTRIRFKLGD